MAASHLYTSDFRNSSVVFYDSTTASSKGSSLANRGQLNRAVEIKFNTDSTLSHPICHKLIYDCHTIFMKAQAIARVEGGMLRLEGALIMNQRYRLAVQNAIDLLQSEPETDMIREFASTLYASNMLWSLFEATYMKPQGRSIVVDLLDWARDSFTFPTELLNTVINGAASTGSSYDKHDLYWNAVIAQVLVGDFTSAYSLLTGNSRFDHDVLIQRMAKIFRSLKVDILHDKKNWNEFIETQKQVRDLLLSGHFNASDDLRFICSILIGDKSAFKQIFETLSENWYEVLPAYILFCHPEAEMDHVFQISKSLYSQLTPVKQPAKLDEIIFAILSLDYLKALQLICVTPSSLWFAVHLTDMIYKINNEMVTGEDTDVRARLFHEYSSILFTVPQLWDVAVDYVLESGAENASELLDTYIASLPVDSVKSANRLLQICQKHGLIRAHLDITKAMALKFERKSEWSEALCWAIRNESNDLVTQIAHKVLLKASPENISRMAMFEQLADKFLLSPALIFLHKYYQFNQLSRRGFLQQGAQMLCELIEIGLAPAEFHTGLFENMAKLLNASNEGNDLNSMIDRNTICDLMRRLAIFETQEVVRLQGVPENEQVDRTKLNIQISVLRRILVQSLANRTLTKAN